MKNIVFIGILIILAILLLFFTNRDSYCHMEKANTQIESNTFRFYPRLNSQCNLNVSTDRDG